MHGNPAGKVIVLNIPFGKERHFLVVFDRYHGSGRVDAGQQQ